jgi:hypothetical protein
VEVVVALVKNNFIQMFRILLLVFIFLYFSGNFFYWFVTKYIPFKYAQNINIYTINEVFLTEEFQNFMKDVDKNDFYYEIKNLWLIQLKKIKSENFENNFHMYFSQWILLTLPYKSYNQYNNFLEIIIPIFDDLWDIIVNDTQFNLVNITHSQHEIKEGKSYLNFWVDYSKMNHLWESIEYKHLHSLFLNKLYIIKTEIEPDNFIFSLR